MFVKFRIVLRDFLKNYSSLANLFHGGGRYIFPTEPISFSHTKQKSHYFFFGHENWVNFLQNLTTFLNEHSWVRCTNKM